MSDINRILSYTCNNKCNKHGNSLSHHPISTRDSYISPRAEGQWAGIRFALLLLRTSARRKKMYENGINLHTHQKNVFGSIPAFL